MGIHDRDYYRPSSRSVRLGWASTPVGTIVLICLGVWILQLMFDGRGFNFTRDVVGCSPRQIFDGFPQLWRLVTANFAHGRDVWHIAINLLILWLFGRELEQMYGKKDFWFLFLAAGVCAVFGETLILQIQAWRLEGTLAELNAGASGERLTPWELRDLGTNLELLQRAARTKEATTVIGASGAVYAVAVLYTMFYPRRTVLLFFFIPAPLWLVCTLYIVSDLAGALSPHEDGVAHFAHLTGAAFGFLFWKFDLRWTRLASRWRGGRARRRAARGDFEVIHERPVGRAPPPALDEETDDVSRRVDELLAKISAEGMGSLSDEERRFLEESSKRYRKR